jgi:hypothetical protein
MGVKEHLFFVGRARLAGAVVMIGLGPYGHAANESVTLVYNSSRRQMIAP